MSSGTSKHSDNASIHGAQRTPWGPWRAVIGILISFYAAQEITGLVLAAFVHTRHWPKSHVDAWATSITTQFIYIFIVETLTLAAIYLFLRGYPQRIVRTSLGLGKPRWRDVGYAVVGFGLYYVLYSVVLQVSSIFITVNLNQKQDIGFTSATGAMNLTLTFISLVVLPPIVEEIAFRGFLFRGLRRYWSPVIAALITSVLFAIPHAMQSTDGSTLWNAAIDTFSLSLVLCYLRETTGALYAGMGVHAAKNLVAFLALFIFHVQ